MISPKAQTQNQHPSPRVKRGEGNASAVSEGEVLPTTFTSPASSSRIETVVLSSRFIADAIPITTEKEITESLTRIRKEFHAATHHCWAWRMGVDQPQSRSSDDGEPSGTAGRPILTALERHDITNTLIIVTRYFGGTKLGTGGLARAYAEAAEEVLRGATIVTNKIMTQFRVTLPYDFLPRVKTLIYKEGSIIEETFDDSARLLVSIPRHEVDRVKSAITDISKGRATFTAE